MKTPKREYKKYYLDPATGEPDEWALGNIDARWHRKNREAQYKRTIAKLTRMLKNTEQCLLATQKMTGFGCFRPSHWENVFVNKEEEEEKKRLKTLKRLIRKLKPNDKP